MDSNKIDISPISAKEIKNRLAGMTVEQRSIALSIVPTDELINELQIRFNEYEQVLTKVQDIVKYI